METVVYQDCLFCGYNMALVLKSFVDVHTFDYEFLLRCCFCDSVYTSVFN